MILVARVKAQRILPVSPGNRWIYLRAAAFAAADARIPLAKLAVEESGMGIVEDKVIKTTLLQNISITPTAYMDENLRHLIGRPDLRHYHHCAEPIGIICGIVPTTNPTSTAIFKSANQPKTRNGIIFLPIRVQKATNRAAEIVFNAAVAASAQRYYQLDRRAVQWNYQCLMHHADTNLILATGGPGMVKAVYSSGKPAVGVGAGNAPIVIDEFRRYQTRGGLYSDVKNLR